MTDSKLDSLFEETDFGVAGGMARCGCGSLYRTDFPIVCKCGERKLFWRTIDGKLKKLSDMDLGHLTNVVKMFSSKIEEYPIGSTDRSLREEAIDLFYAEIATRDKEIVQITGIHAALTRSLVGKDPVDAG